MVSPELPAPPRLAVITSQFPELHETFILRELLELRRRGYELSIISLKPCRDAIIHPEARGLMAQTVYAPFLCSVALWATQAHWLFRHPLRWLDAFGRLVWWHRGSPGQLGKLLVLWPKLLYFARVIERRGLEHLHAHWATMPASAAMVIGRLLGVPWSMTAHAWDIFVRNPTLADKLRRAAFVLTCTEYNRRRLVSLVPEAEGRVLRIYHGVKIEPLEEGAAGSGDAEDGIRHAAQPPSTPQPSAARGSGFLAQDFSSGLPGAPSPQPPANEVSGHTLVLSVGRLVETKGLLTLIDACGMLQRRGHRVRCVIVGDGPLRGRLQRRIRQLDLEERVQLAGSLPQREVRALYRAASVFVLPSVVARNGDRDGIPNVILEAMAEGLPVVSTNVSGIPEAVVDGVTGRLVRPGDSRALAGAVEGLLRDPQRARELGLAGRRMVEERFSQQQHMQVLNETLRARITPAGRARILYVIWSLAVGGAERVVSLLARHVDRAKYEPVVACLNGPGELSRPLEAAGVRVLALNKRGPIDVRALLGLVRIIRRERIDLVHTHLWGANLWGRLAAWWTGCPVVSTEHSTDFWKPSWYVALDRLLARLTRRMIAVSEAVRAFYVNRGVAPGLWETIPNGIETAGLPSPYRSTMYETLGWPERAPIFVLVGRLVEAKNIEGFIDAMAALIEHRPQALGLVVGEGLLRAALESLIRQRGIAGRVVLAGARDDVPAILRGARAVVFTSHREGLPMALLEAMASGIPVIAPSVGGLPEAIEDGLTGWLLKPGDRDALVERLMMLTDDPQLAERLGSAAQVAARTRWSVEEMACRHERLYQQILQDADQRGSGRSWLRAEGSGLRATDTHPLGDHGSCPQPRTPSPEPGARSRADGSTPKIRVAYVIDHLDPGGAQSQLLELARHLPRDRFACSVVSLSAARHQLMGGFRSAGIEVTVIDQSGTWSWSCLLSLRRHLGALRPDIVHTWLFTADLYGRLAARLVGVPAVVSSIRSVEPWKKRHHIWADRVLQQVTDLVTVNAEAIRPILIRRERIRPEKIQTVYNGVDTGVFAPHAVDGETRRAFGFGADPVIGIISRLSSEKDPVTFVQAAGLVLREAPSARFLVVGSGPLEEALRAEARRAGIDGRTLFAGFRPDRAAMLQAMDVVVLSSLYEGCANAILEAMAMAKPVVATDVGGNRELIIPGQTGLLVPSRSPSPMAEAILRLLRDPRRAQAMGEAGRRRVEQRFSLERMVTETAALYERVVLGGAGRRQCVGDVNLRES